MSNIDMILTKINKLFIDLGFSVINIGGKRNFVMGNTYCIPQYVEALGFLIEYADSKEEAQKNWHEDGISFPLSLGEKAILEGIATEIIDNTADLQRRSPQLQVV
ncbi:MAG: hypothetical protein FWD03_04660 [Defluviitaleaceae bacterium]|nr:hypothetical protein [Defluviitaleaceae bacterium]